MRKDNPPGIKPAVFIGSALKDLKKFPDDVRRDVGHALHQAQGGHKADAAKPLVSFSGAGVMEIVEDHRGDTYRAVYTVRLEGYVFVLHCFQKKSRHGIATSKQDNDLIEQRYKDAVELHAHLRAQGKKR